MFLYLQKNLFRDGKGWSKRRITLVSILALLSGVAATEIVTGNITLISTYLVSDLDSTAEGKILESKFWYQNQHYRRSPSAHYDIRYSYQIGQSTYVSEMVNVDPPRFWNLFAPRRELESTARSLVERYPIGSEVTVYYDPRMPDFSVLEVTGLGWTPFIDTLTAILTIPLVVWILSRGRI